MNLPLIRRVSSVQTPAEDVRCRLDRYDIQATGDTTLRTAVAPPRLDPDIPTLLDNLVTAVAQQVGIRTGTHLGSTSTPPTETVPDDGGRLPRGSPWPLMPTEAIDDQGLQPAPLWSAANKTWSGSWPGVGNGSAWELAWGRRGSWLYVYVCMYVCMYVVRYLMYQSVLDEVCIGSSPPQTKPNSFGNESTQRV